MIKKGINYLVYQYKRHIQMFQDGFIMWKIHGSPIPPPHRVKEQIVHRYQREYKCKYFLETGTFQGEMVNAAKKWFISVKSVELSEQLYKENVARFAEDKNVQLYYGDSGIMIEQMIRDFPETKGILFFLDGHYSGGVTAKGDTETPIMHELAIILKMVKDCVIIIDDAKDFTGEGDYISLTDLKEYVYKNADVRSFDVYANSILILI